MYAFSTFASLALLLAPSLVQASVYVIDPVQSSTCTGGQSCEVQWVDNGDTPLLSTIGECQVGLYTGEFALVQSLPSVDVSTTSSFTFTPDPSVGPNGQYYIVFTASSINYQGFSGSFTLAGMSGTTPTGGSSTSASATTSATDSSTSAGSTTPTDTATPSTTGASGTSTPATDTNTPTPSTTSPTDTLATVPSTTPTPTPTSPTTTSASSSTTKASSTTSQTSSSPSASATGAAVRIGSSASLGSMAAVLALSGLLAF